MTKCNVPEPSSLFLASLVCRTSPVHFHAVELRSGVGRSASTMQRDTGRSTSAGGEKRAQIVGATTGGREGQLPVLWVASQLAESTSVVAGAQQHFLPLLHSTQRQAACARASLLASATCGTSPAPKNVQRSARSVVQSTQGRPRITSTIPNA